MATSTSQPDNVRLHVIKAESAVIRMALLGKLYPENIVLFGEEEQLRSYALDTRKGFAPQFAIIGGEALQR